MNTNKGGRRSEPKNNGIVTIVMPMLAGVAFPGNLTSGSTLKAVALQDAITAHSAVGLVAEYPGERCPQEGSPLIKFNGTSFTKIKHRSPEAFTQLLQQSTDHYNRRAGGTAITVKTFKKVLIDLGFSIDSNTGTLTFDLGIWNKRCYRLQAGGMSKTVGSNPNLIPQAIPEIPQFYRDFGTGTGTAVVNTSAAAGTTTVVNRGGAGLAGKCLGFNRPHPILKRARPTTTCRGAPLAVRAVQFGDDQVLTFTSEASDLATFRPSLKQHSTPATEPKAAGKRRARDTYTPGAVKKVKRVDISGKSNVHTNDNFCAQVEVALSTTAEEEGWDLGLIYTTQVPDDEYNLVDAPAEYHNLIDHTLNNPSQTDCEGRTFAQAFTFQSSMSAQEYKIESVETQSRSVNIKSNHHGTLTGTGSCNVFPFPTFDIPEMDKKKFAVYESMDKAKEVKVHAMDVDIEDMSDSRCVISVSDLDIPAMRLSKEELVIYQMNVFRD